MYLYGASVQGIQDFIFKTNKLQEIVGASEIVKSIGKKFSDNYTAKEVLLNAAGNIKVVLSEEACKHAVLNFPKEVGELAYGVTISQAVVPLQSEQVTQEEMNILEKRLKIQRNKVTVPLDPSLNILELNPTTAKPVVAYRKSQGKTVPSDMATLQKVEANTAFFKKNPGNKEFKNLSEMSNSKNKIAVIHADGNGLGMLIPKLIENGHKISAFSEALDKATKEAFEEAKNDTMSIRSVVLGGDDMTVICNANDALEFIKNYLEVFEEKTSNIKELQGLTDKLTACAGIAYTNEKYPFHYAVSLAEALCGVAKNASGREASCVMFHNIQSSNFQSWTEFVEEELTIKNEKADVRCDYGPYYLHTKGEPLLADFIRTLEAYRCEGSPISRLRAWIGELYNSREYADSMLERINQMAKESSNWNACIMEKNLKKFNTDLSNEQLIVQKDGVAKTPIYDVLQILSATEAK